MWNRDGVYENNLFNSLTIVVVGLWSTMFVTYVRNDWWFQFTDQLSTCETIFFFKFISFMSTHSHSVLPFSQSIIYSIICAHTYIPCIQVLWGCLQCLKIFINIYCPIDIEYYVCRYSHYDILLIVEMCITPTSDTFRSNITAIA